MQTLEATGTATVRSRRPPAEQVVWLVIGMALFSSTVAPSSVARARARFVRLQVTASV